MELFLWTFLCSALCEHIFVHISLKKVTKCRPNQARTLEKGLTGDIWTSISGDSSCRHKTCEEVCHIQIWPEEQRNKAAAFISMGNFTAEDMTVSQCTEEPLDNSFTLSCIYLYHIHNKVKIFTRCIMLFNIQCTIHIITIYIHMFIYIYKQIWWLMFIDSLGRPRVTGKTIFCACLWRIF